MRDTLEYDIVVVGGGPSGLASAIRLKQHAREAARDLSVCVLEKGAEAGAHIISGAVMDTRGLDELLPGWENAGAPPAEMVTDEAFLFLSGKGAVRVPAGLLPPTLKNRGHRIVSLSGMVRWLAEQAEALGVDIFPGFAATEILYTAEGAVRGVATGAAGIDRNGIKTASYQPGVEIEAAYTLFAEGARGQLGRQLTERFSLAGNADPQGYAIGLKEIWQVRPEMHRPGFVMHTAGWPLDNGTYGGSFLYHMPGGRVAVGFTVGLAYANPWLSPFEAFQRFKTHPSIRVFLEGGERLEYGARAIAAGGLQALPEVVFPGGGLVGCNAGFMNGARLKGIHTAIKSGMLAADAAFSALAQGRKFDRLDEYPALFRRSWMYDELYPARNFKPLMSRGLRFGTLMFGMDQFLFGGKAPWTLHRKQADHESLKPAAACEPPVYGKPDGELGFDIMSSLYLSGTHHEENQPSHLLLKDESLPVSLNLAKYAGPESRYCPAAVYSFVPDEKARFHLHIQAANCLHCKACDIKDPAQNIVWVAPEGGGGPNYRDM